MSAKIKGIYKTFKYIAQIFVAKEREIEIGYPTDVKHVAHIGLDDPSVSDPSSAPTWMSEFKTLGDSSERRDSSATAVTARSHWSSHSQDFDLSIGYQSASDMSRELQFQPTEMPKKSKKKKKSIKITHPPKTTKSKTTSTPNYHLI